MIIIALALASQVPYVGFDEDRKAFAPFRQCVLSRARQEYLSATNLKTIYETASKSCVAQEAAAAADIALNTAQRTIEAAAHGEAGAELGGDRMGMFERELLFELAEDFVPKAK